MNTRYDTTDSLLAASFGAGGQYRQTRTGREFERTSAARELQLDEGRPPRGGVGTRAT